MKTCPRCNRTYPDSEVFCAEDGTALVSSSGTFRMNEPDRGQKVECPVCGGKAEPGEIICNFCGARLDQQPAGAPPPSSGAPTQIGSAPQPEPRGTTQVHLPSGEFPPEEDSGRRGLGIGGYVIAALIALAAGAWFALRLSHPAPHGTGAIAPSTISSPVPMAAAGPMVVLADGMPVQVSGAGSASGDRDAEAARKAFSDNRQSLLDVYNAALSTDPKTADGMLVRIHVNPDGSVDRAAIRTSTAATPALDAEVAKAMLGWKFTSTGAGDSEADYPVIFARNSAEQANIESALHAKVASLAPGEPPEYASVNGPAPAVSPAAESSSAAMAGAPTSAPAIPPAAAVPPSAAIPPSVVTAPPRRTRPHRVASAPKPKPPLFKTVEERLRENPKLRRVKSYTTGGTVTLYGHVYDDNDKMLAEQVARSILGVTGVNDTITTDMAQWAQEQDAITRQLQSAGLIQVQVKVIGHDAFLSGQVKTELEKTRAVTVAESAAPITVRENLIRVVPGNMFGF